MTSTSTRVPSNVSSQDSSRITSRQIVTVSVLCFVNLINYMDRYTLAGILTDVEVHFKLSNDKSGLLQTAFVVSYMVMAPLFGYLGDRYSRKIIMASGVLFWSGATLVGSFMDDYYWFLAFRTLVGVGEASYSTVAPATISDLFVKSRRSQMLALFYFAIPVGSGLGYIVGSATARITDNWRNALRVTPSLGVIAVLLMLFVTSEPKRGESEGRVSVSTTTWIQDIKQLLTNPSFMWLTLGFTCVSFVGGALAWWGPHFVLMGRRLQPGHEDAVLSHISMTFGIITMISGVTGVPLGAFLATKLKKKYPRVDPLICGAGLLFSSPLLFAAALTANVNIHVCFVLIFFGELLINLNWAIVTDILMYVVHPSRRSTATALQILISHLFGDACSPYLIGIISEALKPVIPGKQSDFYSLQYAQFLVNCVQVLGGVFFLLNAIWIVRDREIAEKGMTSEGRQNSSGESSNTLKSPGGVK